MMTEILFLGTSGSVPSRERSLPCVAIRMSRDIILFDCGEGSQRQLMISPFSFMKIKAIFVSHMHGDHFLGIPGLLQTMNMSGRKEDILLVGPDGFRDTMDHLIRACGRDVGYNIDIIEASGGDTFVFKEFVVRAFDVLHNIPSLGYIFEENERRGRFNRPKAISLGIQPGPDFSRLQRGETVNGVCPEEVIGPPRKGRRTIYSGDTVKCPQVIRAAKDADVLIHEATYSSADSKLAEEHMHSTAADAAETAREANASVLLITHVSGRYNDHSVLEDECRKIFPNTVLAKDMLLFSVK